MSINSREKGAGGELEFSRMVQGLLGTRLVRNLAQPRGGGHDLDTEGGGSKSGITIYKGIGLLDIREDREDADQKPYRSNKSVFTRDKPEKWSESSQPSHFDDEGIPV